MTREEAISWLVSLAEHEGEDIPIYDTDVEALNMAIKALEHPEKNVVAIVPCGDTISRQAVIDLMMQKWGENFSGDDAMQESIDAIREMPSVTPQEPVLDKIWNIVFPLSIMSTDKMEHEAIMRIAEMLEPLCLPESEDKE